MCWSMSICPYVTELLLVGLLVILPVAHCCTSPRTSREFHPPHCLLYRGRWSPMPAWVLWRRRLSGRGPCRSFQLWGSRLCNPLALWWAHAPKHENGDRPIFVWVVSELPLCALERSRYVLRKGCASHAAGIIILFFPPRFWHLWQFFQSFPTHPPTFHPSKHHPPGLGVPLPVPAASFRSQPGALRPGALRRRDWPRLAPGAAAADGAAAAAPGRRGAERRGDGRGAGHGRLQGPWDHGAVDVGMSWCWGKKGRNFGKWGSWEMACSEVWDAECYEVVKCLIKLQLPPPKQSPHIWMVKARPSPEDSGCHSESRFVMPVPSFNVINGGSHAGNRLACQARILGLTDYNVLIWIFSY